MQHIKSVFLVVHLGRNQRVQQARGEAVPPDIMMETY